MERKYVRVKEIPTYKFLRCNNCSSAKGEQWDSWETANKTFIAKDTIREKVTGSGASQAVAKGLYTCSSLECSQCGALYSERPFVLVDDIEPGNEAEVDINEPKFARVNQNHPIYKANK
jgi:hypothetical protein